MLKNYFGQTVPFPERVEGNAATRFDKLNERDCRVYFFIFINLCLYAFTLSGRDLHIQPAVDMNDLAGDIVGLFGCQKFHDFGDIFHAAKPFQRNLLHICRFHVV